MEFRLIENSPIFHVPLPELIISELDEWKMACDEIKNHPLGIYKLHENVGSEFNAYQISVPQNLVISSFWLAYTLRICGKIAKRDHRDFSIRSWPGHFDGYDLWINYAYKGNSNPVHSHSGFFSGVIYLNNEEDKTVFPKCNVEFKGVRGDMIIFPSTVLHEVKKQEKDYERTTFAFNINRCDFAN